MHSVGPETFYLSSRGQVSIVFCDSSDKADIYTGFPYFKFLKKEGKEDGRDVSHSDFAVLQRETLENYLRGLIRAVVRPVTVYFISDHNKCF